MRTGNRLAFARRLAAFLEGLTEQDITDIERGSAFLEVSRAKDFTKRRRRKRLAVPSKTELRRILDDLDTILDREAGFAKLDGEIDNKAGLEALARLADLPVQRRDTRDDLRHKIIEATIGYRLRSRAVQGRGEDTDPK